MSIYDQLKPPHEGDYPEWFKFPDHGNVIEGVITDTRVVQPKTAGDEPYPVLEIQLADGTRRSVGCGATALYRKVYDLRPEVGGMIRITFQGYAGPAKLFDVQYAGPANGAPAAAPAPAAPTAAPAGFGTGAAAPWANQPAAPAPAPAAAPPWGQ